MLKIPYHNINASFAGIFLAVFIYSGIFSGSVDNHPISCPYKKLGTTCPTCGISKSFSSIIRGDLKNAQKLNANGMPVFLFFAIQFFFRLSASFILYKNYIKKSLLMYFDIAISVVLFLVCFMPLAIEVYNFSP